MLVGQAAHHHAFGLVSPRDSFVPVRLLCCWVFSVSVIFSLDEFSFPLFLPPFSRLVYGGFFPANPISTTVVVHRSWWSARFSRPTNTPGAPALIRCLIKIAYSTISAPNPAVVRSTFVVVALRKTDKLPHLAPLPVVHLAASRSLGPSPVCMVSRPVRRRAFKPPRKPSHETPLGMSPRDHSSPPPSSQVSADPGGLMTAWKSRTLWTTVVLFVLLFVTPGTCGTSVPAVFVYTEGTENERIKYYFRVRIDHNVKKQFSVDPFVCFFPCDFIRLY